MHSYKINYVLILIFKTLKKKKKKKQITPTTGNLDESANSDNDLNEIDNNNIYCLSKVGESEIAKQFKV